MPVFTSLDKKLNILFIHIPKCAGGSVAYYFLKNGFSRSCDGPPLPYLRCQPQHMYAEMLNSIFDVHRFDYAFSFVRNPVHRIISEYKFRIEHPMAAHGIDSWYERARSKYATNNYFLTTTFGPHFNFSLKAVRGTRWKTDLV